MKIPRQVAFDAMIVAGPGDLVGTGERRRGRGGAGGHLPQQMAEIGQLVGMTREKTNRYLRAWEARDWVKLERGSIIVRKPDALAAMAAAGEEE